MKGSVSLAGRMVFATTPETLQINKNYMEFQKYEMEMGLYAVEDILKLGWP
jgi:hypothetical protein